MAFSLENETENKRIAGERETRRKFYEYALREGGEILAFEYVQLMNKFDGLIKNCTNPQERDDLCSLAAMEVTNLLFGNKDVAVIK